MSGCHTPTGVYQPTTSGCGAPISRYQAPMSGYDAWTTPYQPATGGYDAPAVSHHAAPRQYGELPLGPEVASLIFSAADRAAARLNA